MTETMSKWERFNYWADKTMVPVNYVALVFGLIVIVESVALHDYDFWFWASLAVTAWATYDAVKWYRRKRKANPRPIGPEDSPDWN